MQERKYSIKKIVDDLSELSGNGKEIITLSELSYLIGFKACDVRDLKRGKHYYIGGIRFYEDDLKTKERYE